MDDYLDDYEPLTAPMQFRVGRAGRGRGLFATEALPSGEDILEEVPLVAWLLPATGKGEDTDAMVCDVCLSVFPRGSINLQCSDATCGARFCSEECATGSAHKALCGGALPALRARKAGEHGESLARCNLRIAQDVASFASSYGLEAPVALLNALRPFERLCTCPPDREPPWYRRLCLTDAAGEALAEQQESGSLGSRLP